MKRETLNFKRETRNLKPETLNPKPPQIQQAREWLTEALLRLPDSGILYVLALCNKFQAVIRIIKL